MLKRFVEDKAPAPPTTPTKKTGGLLIRNQQSPTKEYAVEILFRPIIDCESKQLLGATLENAYPLKDWIKGEAAMVTDNSGEELFVPATGPS
jgi:hypothetical protein